MNHDYSVSHAWSKHSICHPNGWTLKRISPGGTGLESAITLLIDRPRLRSDGFITIIHHGRNYAGRTLFSWTSCGSWWIMKPGFGSWHCWFMRSPGPIWTSFIRSDCQSVFTALQYDQTDWYRSGQYPPLQVVNLLPNTQSFPFTTQTTYPFHSSPNSTISA